MLQTAAPAATVGLAPAVTGRVRRWARISMVAHIVFVAAFLIAACWQGPDYSVTAHSVSDMYAEGAPYAAVLILILTCCGVAALLFVFRSLRLAGGWGRLGCVLLALSPFGLGDLLTPFERLACL